MNQPLSEIDKVSDKVRDFYDKHPYPPPVQDLSEYRRQWQDEKRRRADFYLFWPNEPYRQNLDILVAGCGTSQAAKYALRYPEARVVGIDIGDTSLRETKKLKEKYDLGNLELEQLTVERVDELEERFDLVVCTGVLHHLPDPDAGLRALRGVLKSTGAIHLMVYATYGRTGIYMIQEYCRRLGIGNSEEEITELAATLMTMPPAHPLGVLLGESPDFRRKAALADALLNPQDRAYTVPQLFDFIEGSGLIFGRWLRQAPYLPQCGDLANTPHTDRLAQFPVQEQYAAVELFRGTILRHSAICYRENSLNLTRPVQFDDKEWLSYIPHRLPKTTIVEERLPPGAVAVLINQSHTDTDIFLPINEEEKQLVEAIDGQRSIAEIVAPVAARQGGGVRTFFQKLWWYDQISVDASNVEYSNTK
jgi:2-polyprenyl-3-methyl-5-hydroxy-6-metoxy-1,4-benzoquinol methylase